MAPKRKDGENGKDPATGSWAGPDRRAGDRRSGKERREREVPVVRERRSGKERRAPEASTDRRKTVRRINEYVLEPDVLEFINAVNEYKSVNQRPFPTWSEIYQIFVSLGYEKGR